jgi:hypothetical protein
MMQASLLAQPLPRLSSVGVIKVADCCFREGLAEQRHTVLPPLFSDHRKPFNVAV